MPFQSQKHTLSPYCGFSQVFWEVCHGAGTFRLTEVLTGHGCFAEYLCWIVGTEVSAVCHHCDNCPLNTTQHTLELCPAWDEKRSALRSVVGDPSLPAVVAFMVGSQRSWRAAVYFCEVVISQKEGAERDREREDPSRVQRRLRRRRVDD
ncbi:uncharacterized protein LOC119190426 [Manduca sexta]|uniref:uncharacterized protein LOC119190426 n=1 Tax=Manduca sexta TaxID=7130 RepID=UPI0018908542|nr:uncharacterized protein LOC119190426 [Manduca sexta]